MPVMPKAYLGIESHVEFTARSGLDLEDLRAHVPLCRDLEFVRGGLEFPNDPEWQLSFKAVTSVICEVTIDHLTTKDPDPLPMRAYEVTCTMGMIQEYLMFGERGPQHWDKFLDLVPSLSAQFRVSTVFHPTHTCHHLEAAILNTLDN
jgi:hypothetical protein